MRQDKDIAFKLRKEGKSYREIQNELVISRSTLCEWFKNEEWSRHIKNKNNRGNIQLSTERLQKLNKGREEKLLAYYKKAEEDAFNEYRTFILDPLFVAGLMLYAGEGDHLSRNTIRFTNVDFELHKIFINFVKKFFNKGYDSIKFSVLLYPDLNIENCVDKWCQELGIYRQNVYKPQIIAGKLKTRKLHFGVGTSIILSSFLKRKLLFWIKMTKNNLG